VVAQDPPAGGPNECQANASPFIDQCGYDQAGIILQHICGALNAPKRGALDGTVKQFAQSLYSKPNSVSSLSLGETGYGFVPKECGQGETCRVHIALHGYKQGVGDIDRGFVDYGGYNAWADTNRIIVLYPQPPPAGIPSTRKPAGIGGVTWITTTATSPSRDRRSGHQGDARRGYPARGAGGGSRPCSHRARQLAQGHRHLGHRRRSSLDPTAARDRPPRVSRRPRWQFEAVGDFAGSHRPGHRADVVLLK
jgi:hypothetical protein